MESLEQSKSGNALGLVLLAAGVAMAGFAIVSTRRRHGFSGDAVLITGGSRGLGLVLARQLAGEGARLAICARDAADLARAAADLRKRGGEVIELVCDVRNRVEAEMTLQKCVDHYGGIDVLINNAGVIQVGPLETQTEKDFRDSMDTHFWGPFYMMQAAIPVMKRRGKGRIVNISSIGGKVAVPHLAPYCASKFALVGLSSGMQVELAKYDIAVTTVCPGLMRTGSHVNAEFKGQNEKEYALFSIADALPISSTSAENAARQILNACRRGDAELIISLQAKLAAKMNAVFPGTTSTLLAIVDRVLPSAGDNGTGKSTGLESTSAVSPSFITASIDAASKRNNELKPGESLGGK